jgi:hypothetical protein
VCFTCPARVFVGGEDYCNPMLLDDRKIIQDVSRLQPDGCPGGDMKAKSQKGRSPEMMLMNILGR